jgi:hypothetical protein
MWVRPARFGNVSRGHRQNVNSTISGMSSDLTEKRTACQRATDEVPVAREPSPAPGGACPRLPRNRRSSRDPTTAPATKVATSAVRRCHLEGISDSRQGVNRRKPMTEARVHRPTMILTGKHHSQDGLKFRLAGEGKFRWD